MNESDHQTTFEAPDPAEVAMLFPAYDVHALIACGGMGAVYQATQRSLDRPVAIKILPREFSKDEAFRSGFEAEAKAMAKLNHPNLIGVYDFGEVDGMLFIVMEYVHGKSLYHSARGRQVEESEALRIVSDVCHGLAHAHEHGILHRDIKPGNILLDENANPKIGDFGLARALESEIQEGEQIFGTPGYTAPEVVEPPFTFDHRADIFSVGVMLYELLTGRTPDSTEALPSHLQVSNPRVNAIIEKATDPDPNLRFSSAKELAANIAKIGSPFGNAMATDEPSVSYSPKKFTSKSASGGTLVLLLLGAGAAAIIFFVKSQKDKTTEGQQNVDKPVVTQIVITPDPPVVQEPPDIPSPPADPPPPLDTTPVVDSPPPEELVPQEDPGGDFEDFNPFDSELIPVKPKVTETVDPEPEKPEKPEPPKVEPKYDVAGFFDRARGIMKQKVAPDIEAFKADIATNTDGFERKLRLIAADYYGERRDDAERNLQREYENWQRNDYMIAQRIPRMFQYSDEARGLHSGFLEAQNNFKERLALKLRLQSDTYITGIEFQIKRLEGTDDQAAIDLLQREIDMVKQNPDYFRSLMLK